MSDTPSDQIRRTTAQEYLQAHAKPSPNGLRGFFHSNLFVALLLWSLSQGVIVGGVVISYYFKTTQLSEWKGQIDAKVTRMDEQGTHFSHSEIHELDRRVTNNEVRLDRMEQDTRHLEVIESEHRRLTKDVEELQHGRK